MATNPTLLVQPIAANGAKNVIPNTTSTAGAMSQDQGFPAETALPLGAGGVAPTREDFNGAFNLLSGLLFYAQKGWQFEFDETQDYFAGCIVRDTLDGKLYEAINDVSASSTHPSADSVNWKLGTDMSAYTTTVNAPMFNKRDTITTSGTYTAPVTGWYKITVKGGGGGGGGSRYAGGPTYITLPSGGGGEGGTAITYERMTAGDTATVTIGAGGTGATANANNATTGGNGGDSSVTINSNTYTAGGGKGGTSYNGEGGAGGTGTIYGACGGTAQKVVFSGGGNATGGNGGGGGGSIGTTEADPTNGVNGGGGAGGSIIGSTTVKNGTNGGNGYVWFEYFDSTLNP